MAGDTEVVRLTMPLNPLTPVTVMVEDPVPTLVCMVTEVGLAAIVKS